MQKMMQISEEERMKAMAKNKKMCICANYLSYVGTGEVELLFCATEKSKIITEEKKAVFFLHVLLRIKWG